MQLTAFIQKSRYCNMSRFRQILRIMRLTCFFLISFCLHIAARSNGQTVSLSVKNAGITQVLKQIQEQTGYNIIAENSLLEKIKKVSVKLTNVRLEEVLDAILKEYPITYSIQNKTIIFKAGNTNNHPVKEVVKPVEDIAETLVFKLEGKVTDVDGKPMVKVTVYNNTLKKGTTTNEDGTFVIDAEKGDVITFSYVGYKPEKITVVSSGKVSIKMELVEKDLEEFVATGYQNIRKQSMTGATSKVKAEDLVINGTNTVEQILQGKLAGVQVVNGSGMIGTRQAVRVRGVSTLFGSQEPVWVVDGIIQEDPLPFQAKELNRFNQEPSSSQQLKDFIGSAISWLNPYDIEEVTVLKDAASTAIYGVKAANGVILITTRRGKPGSSPTISYNGGVSTESKLSYNKMNLMDSNERVDVSREVYERGLVAAPSLNNVGYQGLLKQFLEDKINYTDFQTGVKQLEVNNTDWFDILMQQPFSMSHNISVSGGGNNNSFYGSFGYNSRQGQAKGNGQTSYKASINYNSNITSRLNIAAKIAGEYTKTTGFYGINPYTYASQTTRVIAPYNADGSLSYYWGSNARRYNVLNELNNSGNSNTKTGITTNINVKYNFNRGFSFESVFGANYSNANAADYASEHTNSIAAKRGYEYGSYLPSQTQYKQSQLPVGGILTTASSTNFNYTWRNTLNFNRTLNGVHTIQSMAGVELRSNKYDGNDQTVYGYLPNRGKSIVSPPLTIVDAAGSNIINPIYINDYKNTITDTRANAGSYFAAGNYTYDRRYTLSLSVRGDGSNRFGQDTRGRFKPIWAMGGRWNVANESFFNNKGWMNDFSIRASYGLQGNVAENYGPDLIAYVPSGSDAINRYTGEPILKIATLPYSDLRWEKTQTVNLGLDLSMFKGRVWG